MRKRKTTRGLLIKGVLEHQPKDVLEYIPNDLKDVIKEESSGIYALYKGKKLYYVGLAKHLIWRIPKHLESKEHKGKWDNFSVFIVKREKHIKDLETLVLRIAKPEGNKLQGKIPQHYEMGRKLRNIIRKYRKISKAYEKKD